MHDLPGVIERLGAEAIRARGQRGGVELAGEAAGRRILALHAHGTTRLVEQPDPDRRGPALTLRPERDADAYRLGAVVEEHRPEVGIEEIDVERRPLDAAQADVVEPGAASGNAVGADRQAIRSSIGHRDLSLPDGLPVGRAAHDVGALPPVQTRTTIETDAHTAPLISGAEVGALHPALDVVEPRLERDRLLGARYHLSVTVGVSETQALAGMTCRIESPRPRRAQGPAARCAAALVEAAIRDHVPAADVRRPQRREAADARRWLGGASGQDRDEGERSHRAKASGAARHHGLRPIPRIAAP